MTKPNKLKRYQMLNVRISFLFLILVLIIALVMSFLVYKISYNHTQKYLERLMIRCGNYVNEVVDAEMVRDWLKNGPDESYDLTEKELEAMCDQFQISYLFVYVPQYDAQRNLKPDVTFVFDLNPPGTPEEKIYHLGEVGKDMSESYKTQEMLETGEAQFDYRVMTENEGELIMVLVPLKLDNDTIYGVIGLCFKTENVKLLSVNTTVLLVVLFESVIILFAALLLIFIHRRIIKPVKMLSYHMDHFVSAGKELTQHDPILINTNDEIEMMTDNFNAMAESIVKYTQDMKTITASQERLKAELDMAGNIRAAVSADLTANDFDQRTDFSLYASLKNTVYNSCSFCNYFLRDEEHLIIVLGESVGKSLPSMLMSMLASTHIFALARMGVEPYKIAYDTNNSLCGFERNSLSMTVSAFICEIDLSTGEMKYVNAGMPPIVLKTTGEAYRNQGEQIQFNLGEMRGVSFVQKTIRLNQGCTFFLTSYGVPEMKNPDGEKFTEERLAKEINAIAASHYALPDMVQSLEQTLDAFRKDTTIELDTTIFAFRYYGSIGS